MEHNVWEDATPEDIIRIKQEEEGEDDGTITRSEE